MQKIYNNIALGYKAQKLILGTDDIIRKIKKNPKIIILISSSASINTFKLIQNKTWNYGVELIVLNDIHQNLEKIFKNKQIKVLAIEDVGFKKLIKANLN
ncbi:MAG: hypothetical protein ACK5HR_02900 [Mycoplasmatales bacterium]